MEPRSVTLKDANNKHSDFRLDGKCAVVTGGARGIGRAIALTFAAHGAFVHVLDIDSEQASATVAEIKQAGGRAARTGCDVCDAVAVQAAFREASKHGHGHVDVLVNSAGIAHIGTLESTSEDDFDSVYRVNVKGVFTCMQAAVPHMKSNGGGVILNIASIAASAGLANRFAYSTTKGAVLSMTYSVAKDYLQHNIRCNSISPARVHTPFVDGFLKKNYPGKEKENFELLARSQPVGRMAQPQEVASLALFLCSDASAFVTGADYPLDGGFFNLRG
ncbi:MAG TPA: SDR family oxidoreductase [Candidatus Acidoferrum sp.]|nr:SDR family oxidoreductase [Candidatus Acidoferrum sp.]